jgi:hypothetical protein
MDTYADIVADTKRQLLEAQVILAKVKAGARLMPNITKEQAIQVLEGDIAHYQQVLRRYNWREEADAPAELRSAAAELGSRGGKARAASLSKRKRSKIAKEAAAKRWAKASARGRKE